MLWDVSTAFGLELKHNSNLHQTGSFEYSFVHLSPRMHGDIKVMCCERQAYKMPKRKCSDGGKTEHKEVSKVQIFTGRPPCRVSKYQNLDTSLGGGVATLKTGKKHL